MNYSAQTLVTTYADAVAFLLAVGMISLSGRIRKWENESYRAFFFMSVNVMAGSLVSFLHYTLSELSFPHSHVFSMISKTLLNLIILQLFYLWFKYLNYKLYGKLKKHSLIYSCYSCITTVTFVLYFINLFTGIVFTYTNDHVFHPTLLYYILRLVIFLIFQSSILIVKIYDAKVGKVRFFHVRPVVLSIMIGTLIHFHTSYDPEMMGYAVGFTLLYFSMASELRFLDEASGFYNRAYLSHVLSMALMKKCNYRSALLFEMNGNTAASIDILKKEPINAEDVIRLEENKFLLYSVKDSRSIMMLLSSSVEVEIKKYNKAHPADPIQMQSWCHIREPDQDILNFMEKALTENEAGELKSVVSIIAEMERLDKELTLAADIQINMLPTHFPAFPDRKEFELYASMNPAKEVGGDFYDFFLVDEDHLALVIADVSGKGIPAALFMMVSKSLLKNQLMSGSSPADAMDKVNRQLCERNRSMMFVTVWLAVIQLSTGKAISCNAGHESPVLRRKEGAFEIVKYEHDVVCAAIDTVRFHEHPFDIRPGDTLFVYTDGVMEAVNITKEQFGAERLLAALNNRPDDIPEQKIRQVQAALDEFTKGAEQFDDITMLCLKYLGSPENGAVR